MKLTMRETAYIAKMYTGLSEISLLANLDEIEDGSELFSLMEKGILESDELIPEAKAMMDIVANARQCSRLFIKNRFGLIEKYVYRFNEERVLVENDEGDMVFSSLKSTQSLRNEVAQMTGESSLKAIKLERLLTHHELLAYFALMDLYRIEALKSYSGDQEVGEVVELEDIVSVMEAKRNNTLSQMLLQNYGLTIPDPVFIEKALHGLIEEGLIDHESGYELSQVSESLAQGLLIPELMITLESLGYNDEGELLTASSLCIGAGVHDLLFIAFGNTDAEIATLSGRELLNLVDNYMMCPGFTAGTDTVKE